jgi:inosose dehydratase
MSTGATAGVGEEAGSARPTPTVRAASAPVCFGVNEILPDGAWMPRAAEILDAIAALDYTGTELGPPGYLGSAPEVRAGLGQRGLALVGAFLPLHFSSAERFLEDRAWLRTTLELMRDAAPAGARPFAVLSEGFGEPLRMRYAGRIAEHPQAALPRERFELQVANLQRAAEDCRAVGLEPVLHPHAATFIETEAEIRRVLEAIDPALLGLCLDTGHARFGGADPVVLAEDYHALIRHVHLKDCSRAVIEAGRRADKGFAELTAEGAFTELGQGDAGVAEVVEVLRAHDYAGWVVVEQDRYLFADGDLEVTLEAQRRNRAWLRELGI